MKKRTIIGVITVMLCVCMFAGCNKKEKESPTGDKQQTQEEQVQEQEETSEKQESESDKVELPIITPSGQDNDGNIDVGTETTTDAGSEEPENTGTEGTEIVPNESWNESDSEPEFTMGQELPFVPAE